MRHRDRALLAAALMLLAGAAMAQGFGLSLSLESYPHLEPAASGLPKCLLIDGSTLDCLLISGSTTNALLIE